MKRWLCLVLAIVLMLAGCQQDQGPAPSGNTSPEETEPSSDPASDWSQGSWEEAVAHYHQYRESAARSEEEMFSGGLPHPPVPGTAPAPDPEGGEPVRVVMQVQEYHSGKDGAGNEDTCQVEIPRLEGGVPGSAQMEWLNRPFVWLAEDWERSLGASHGEGPGMAVHSYPYCNSRWAQVVVHRQVWPSYGYSGDMCSANYDLEERRAVTPEEMLERLGITGEELLQQVSGAGTARLLGLHDPDDLLVAVDCRAFRGREDGSAVFYLLAIHHNALFLADAPPRLLAYDSRDGSVTRIWDKLGGGEEQPDPMDPPLANAEVN
ncbi:MAG: hypothetical protein HFF14_08120 [Angelakisella sp.]|jgi:hypothetical protein|nr:hypothetical protein [Angelakisella sp.]